MEVYEYMYWGDFNARIEELAELALPENWDLPYKTGYPILKNYLSSTFERLQQENKIVETEDYCVFNTGLFTKNYEEIFVYGQMYEITKEYNFVCFCTKYTLGKYRVNQIPKRADYFQKPELLIFDAKCPIHIQYSHILDDENNRNRLPEIILNSRLPLQTLTGCIELSIKKVIANYKLAVPQYYNGRIQLLLPIYFDGDEPELALLLSKTEDGYYLGHTCLTLSMAYNNARVIARQNDGWLKL